MLHSDIIKIAVKNGWQVSITDSEDGFFFDFHRRTLGGLPFCFTPPPTPGPVGPHGYEKKTIVDSRDPEHYAGEWLEISGDLSPSRYFQAVTDMDDIRTRAWLLALDLSEIAEGGDKLLNFPWYRWN